MMTLNLVATILNLTMVVIALYKGDYYWMFLGLLLGLANLAFAVHKFNEDRWP